MLSACRPGHGPSETSWSGCPRRRSPRRRSHPPISAERGRALLEPARDDPEDDDCDRDQEGAQNHPIAGSPGSRSWFLRSRD
jgi:hypothetical protein